MRRELTVLMAAMITVCGLAGCGGKTPAASAAAPAETTAAAKGADSDWYMEALTDAALQEKYPDTTMIIVAQRVSSIKNCDEILVLDHGSISGRGRHEDLIKDNTLYQDIADSQMGGALFD